KDASRCGSWFDKLTTNGSWQVCRRTEAHQRLRVRRRRRLVHEIHMDLSPQRRLEPARPLQKILVRIRFEPEPDIAPWGRLHQRRRRIVFALGKAERRPRSLQGIVDI